MHQCACCHHRWKEVRNIIFFSAERIIANKAIRREVHLAISSQPFFFCTILKIIIFIILSIRAIGPAHAGIDLRFQFQTADFYYYKYNFN